MSGLLRFLLEAASPRERCHALDLAGERRPTQARGDAVLVGAGEAPFEILADLVEVLSTATARSGTAELLTGDAAQLGEGLAARAAASIRLVIGDRIVGVDDGDG